MERGCTQTCTLKHTRVGAVGGEGMPELWGQQDVGQSPVVVAGAPLKSLGHRAGLCQLMGWGRMEELGKI